jgi:hypothetical protein
VEIVMQNREYELAIHVRRDGATSLASPLNGMMDGRIEESMTSEMKICLSKRRKNQIVFEGTGVHAAVEVAGAVKTIMT